MHGALTGTFAWHPESPMMARRACARVRLAEEILALPDDMESVISGAMRAATATVEEAREVNFNRALNAPERQRVENLFRDHGGDGLLRIAAALSLPVDPEYLVRLHHKGGAKALHGALVSARVPPDLKKEKANAEAMRSASYHEAIAEQVEHLRSVGESWNLPLPVNMRSPIQDRPGLIEDPERNSDCVDVPSENYPPPRNLLRYRKVDLDEFVSDYEKRIARSRSRFEGKITSIPTQEAVPPHLQLADQSYGIEIEGYFGEYVENTEGARAIREAFERNGLQGWRVTQDSSIKRPNDFRTDHPEVVSPVFSAREAPAAITRAMQILRHLGVEVNYSCGLHVNVGDGAGIPLSTAKSVLLNYAHHQAKIDGMLPEHRKSDHNVFAMAPQTPPTFGKRTLVEAAAPPFAESVRSATSFQRLNEVCTCGGKHAAVNLKKIDLAYIEFRQLQGTLEPDVVLDFMHICGKFVEKARTHPLTLTTLDEVHGLGCHGGTPTVAPRSAVVERAAMALAACDGPQITVAETEFPT